MVDDNRFERVSDGEETAASAPESVRGSIERSVVPQYQPTNAMAIRKITKKNARIGGLTVAKTRCENWKTDAVNHIFQQPQSNCKNGVPVSLKRVARDNFLKPSSEGACRRENTTKSNGPTPRR